MKIIADAGTGLYCEAPALRNYRLEDLVRDAIGKRAVWGTDDCVLFAGDASLLQTGFDPIKPWRSAWSSKRQAYEVIAAKGTDLIEALAVVAGELGHIEIDPLDAINGDMGVVIDPDRFGKPTPTTVCKIEQGWLARRDFGVAVRPTALRAWRVRPCSE